jgi:hypothetical protein
MNDTTLTLALKAIYTPTGGIQAPSRVRVNRRWIPILTFFKPVPPMDHCTREFVKETLPQN